MLDKAIALFACNFLAPCGDEFQCIIGLMPDHSVQMKQVDVIAELGVGLAGPSVPVPDWGTFEDGNALEAFLDNRPGWTVVGVMLKMPDPTLN